MIDERLIDRGSDVYCHGIARVDQLGPNRRLVFTVPSLDGGKYQDVVIKLIVPAELLTALACMAVGADQNTASLALLAVGTSTAN
jgi:hypothetical protein